MKKFNQYEKGYLECSIDAEGFLCITRNDRHNGHYGYELVLGWTNTKIEFLQKIKEILNIHNKIGVHNYRKGNQNPTFILHISDSKILIEILSQLKLVLKEGQRQIFLKLAPLIIRGKLTTVVKLR